MTLTHFKKLDDKNVEINLALAETSGSLTKKNNIPTDRLPDFRQRYPITFSSKVVFLEVLQVLQVLEKVMGYLWIFDNAIADFEPICGILTSIL